jgi:hypothetical protein
MNKVALFSVLLVLGLFGSQWLPPLLGRAYGPVSHGIFLLTMIALSFIMIHVGYEFEARSGQSRTIRMGLFGGLHGRRFPLDLCEPLLRLRDAPPTNLVGLGHLEGNFTGRSLCFSDLCRRALLDACGRRPERDLVVQKGPDPGDL